MATLLVVHGPNLNLLGIREPAHYGQTTLDAIDKHLAGIATAAGHTLISFQSNAEHSLIERIHAAAREGVAFIIINPAGYTSTSIAILFALLTLKTPWVQINITNIHQREAFRHNSYVSKAAKAVLAGFGVNGYALAIIGLAGLIGLKEQN